MENNAVIAEGWEQRTEFPSEWRESVFMALARAKGSGSKVLRILDNDLTFNGLSGVEGLAALSEYLDSSSENVCRVLIRGADKAVRESPALAGLAQKRFGQIEIRSVGENASGMRRLLAVSGDGFMAMRFDYGAFAGKRLFSKNESAAWAATFDEMWDGGEPAAGIHVTGL